MRLRVLVLTLVATVGALLSPVGAAHAAVGPVRASIVCDSATNTISTSASGGGGWFTPNSPINVQFLVYYGSYVTATAENLISAKGSTITVQTTSAADGSVSVAGYSRSWNASTYIFYTETVRVTATDPATGHASGGDATCTQDPRTTVTLTCDQRAQTITAGAAGDGFTQLASPLASNGYVRVEYTWTGTSQATADSPAFTRQLPSTPDVTHWVKATAGAWSDVGFVHSVTTNPYYLDQTVVVTVRDNYNSFVIGRGTASCVYADQRPS